MKTRNRWLVSCLIALSVFVALLFISTLALWLLNRASQEKLSAHIPPSVVIYAPASGDVIQAGDILLAYVVASSQYPIEQIELWLDGALLETRRPESGIGEGSTFSISTELHIAEGQHIFSARAVDSHGLVGQSLPVFLRGEERVDFIEITSNGAQTLDDIAAANNADADVVKEINPGLGDGPLPPGTGVVIPSPGGGQSQGANPNTQPPAPPPAIPPGVTMLPIAGPIPNFSDLISTILSTMPKAPTSLQGGFENCKIRLVWMDNADNETHFNVWMQALGGPPKVIATLKGTPQTGPAWYEFASPWPGIYSFWIEAVNAVVGQSSEIVWVGVNDINCGANLATHLTIETTDMYVNGGYDKVYCYLSVEGAPEKRMPTQDGQFVQVTAGWGDVSNWTGNGIGKGGNSFLLPEPGDQEVTLEGKCLGWQGGSGPDDLGTFKASAPKDTWDGRRQELSGGGYTIGYRIQPKGPTQASGNFSFVDYSLPVPFKPWVTTPTSPNTLENEKLARRPYIHWNWIGDQSKLTGFTILMDGKPIKTASTVFAGKNGPWTEQLILPTSCGGVHDFQIVANSGEAISVPSMTTKYYQSPCATYAEVKFETITFGCLYDGDEPVIPFIPMDCIDGSFSNRDTIEPYYWIGVRGSDFINISPGDMTTGIEYSFHDLGFNSGQKNKYSSYDTFLVPIDPFNPAIWFGLNMKDADPWYDPDDHICGIGKDVVMPYADWETYDHVFIEECHSYDGHGWVHVRVRGLQGPSGTREANPGIGPPVGP